VWLRVWLRAACLLAFFLVSLEIHAGTVTRKMQTERLSSGSLAVLPPKSRGLTSAGAPSTRRMQQSRARSEPTCLAAKGSRSRNTCFRFTLN